MHVKAKYKYSIFIYLLLTINLHFEREVQVSHFFHILSWINASIHKKYSVINMHIYLSFCSSIKFSIVFYWKILFTLIFIPFLQFCSIISSKYIYLNSSKHLLQVTCLISCSMFEYVQWRDNLIIYLSQKLPQLCELYFNGYDQLYSYSMCMDLEHTLDRAERKRWVLTERRGPFKKCLGVMWWGDTLTTCLFEEQQNCSCPSSFQDI